MGGAKSRPAGAAADTGPVLTTLEETAGAGTAVEAVVAAAAAAAGFAAVFAVAVVVVVVVVVAALVDAEMNGYCLAQAWSADLAEVSAGRARSGAP